MLIALGASLVLIAFAMVFRYELGFSLSYGDCARSVAKSSRTESSTRALLSLCQERYLDRYKDTTTKTSLDELQKNARKWSDVLQANGGQQLNAQEKENLRLQFRQEMVRQLFVAGASPFDVDLTVASFDDYSVPSVSTKWQLFILKAERWVYGS